MIPASAFILIGGHSRRFGTPKWQAIIDGKTILDHIWNACGKFQEIYTIGKQHRDNNKPFLRDELEIEAPINGLYTALIHTNSDWILLLSCDLPLIDQDTISHLWSSCKSGKDIIVPEVNGELQTTCAFYNKGLKDLVLEQINNRRFSLKELISKVDHHSINMNEKSDYFLNMNTKSDMSSAEKILSSKVASKTLS